MFYVAAAKNAMLDTLDESQAAGAKFGSLHTAYSATGTNELTGGAPAYARKALTWDPATAGAKALNGAVSFDVPASNTPAWLGLWTLVTGGTFLGMAPLGAGTDKLFALDDTTADTLKSEAHGFTNGQTVVVWGAGIPTDIAQGTIYYVVSATTDALQLSLTSGGSAINFTDKGQGFLQRIIPEVFNAQGVYQLTAATLDLGGVA